MQQSQFRVSDLRALSVLDSLLQGIPFLQEMDLVWTVNGKDIVGRLDEGVFRQAIKAATPEELAACSLDLDSLPYINLLHDEYGWKRDGFVSGQQPYLTDLKAWTQVGSYIITVNSTRLASLGRPDGVTNYVIPFFAPPLPSIEALSTPEGQAEADEWHRRLILRDW